MAHPAPAAASPASHPRSADPEALTALIAAAIVFLCMIFAAGVVVLWDFDRFRERVETLFEVDLSAMEMEQSAGQHVRDEARALSEKLIRGADADAGPFRDSTALPRETPSAPALPRLTPGAPRVNPLAPRSPDTLEALHDEAERRARQTALKRAQHGLAARVIALDNNPRSGPKTLQPAAGGGVATLGRPGETRPVLGTLTPPSAPAAAKLLQGPAPATAWPRTETAAAITRKLVEERPPRGYPSLDKDIAATFTVHRPAGSEQAYFRLEIALRPESTLQPIPKDVLFLIDISQSIHPRELEEARGAVAEYIAHLPPSNRANVIAFSEDALELHEGELFANPATLNRARTIEFIRKRPGKRRTDVFLATRVALSRVPDGNRPCHVFLLSDGKATQGASDVRTLVHDFQRVNRDNVGVFVFDGGPGGHKYLLSLLAYRSRGAFESEPDYEKIETRLRAMLERYDEPVLSNVVANYTNLRVDEVYPEVLPNLYRGASVRFWGRAVPGKTIAMRVAGITEEGPREFFFRTTMPEGSDAHPEIVREWARGKAHALMATLADDPENKALRKQIQALARTHGLADVLELVEQKSFGEAIRDLF